MGDEEGQKHSQGGGLEPILMVQTRRDICLENEASLLPPVLSASSICK